MIEDFRNSIWYHSSFPKPAEIPKLEYSLSWFRLKNWFEIFMKFASGPGHLSNAPQVSNFGTQVCEKFEVQVHERFYVRIWKGQLNS